MARRSEKLSFSGSKGGKLAARLDLPDGEPIAYALFAHCFTCSKDIYAASRIAAELSALGFGVLRFDFTGLGASEGEFEHTNFSSNVEDLLIAADHLRQFYRAPQLLIGHSLGGAAVLMAATSIGEVRAVVTIGAPSDTEHVLHNFGAQLDAIERDGVAEVSLAGRPFTVRKQFLDDVRAQTLSEQASKLRRALLVMHAPLDDVVGIDNATRIFVAAKHPKSFVSLDGADHLLSRKIDAEYAAQVLSAWSLRYIEKDGDIRGLDAETTSGLAPDAAEFEDGVVRVAERGGEAAPYGQVIQAGPHRFTADEPKSLGGQDTGATPYDFLAAALGSCTSITLRMYANRKGMALEKITVSVLHTKVHADDCEGCGEGREGRIDVFDRVIDLTGELSPDERQRLLEIADRCPVHMTLEKSSAVRTRLK